MKEKFKYFMKVQHELYDIIYDAMELGVVTVVKMMNKHLDVYNKKSNMYKFTLVEETEFNSQYKFIMSEKQGWKLKPVYQDDIHLKDIIRNRKLDTLLGD